ncbi:hypothetical protein [Sanguibacter suarezii]|uniref:hypothetical protein n=1 Tax=Sanguibacter suarezii TaxID=60921 RepID=UPI00083584DF|nr:hypothetical protein [Sanguibacter suarezii]
MTPATVPAVALAAVLTAVPISSPGALDGAPLVEDPTTTVATETTPVDPAPEVEIVEEVPAPEMPAPEEVPEAGAEDVTEESESFGAEDAPEASEEAEQPDEATDPAPEVEKVSEKDVEGLALTAPLGIPQEESPAPDGAADETSDTTAPAPLAAVTDGYHEDGYDRPFWWASDGLHFRDPIPASGYVNINVPGANNVSIDTNRELIGTTFIPWSYFGLQPGMCIAWTESNGYNYHFGEDNSGRGGVDERDWTYCVPEVTEPEKPVDPVDPPVDPVDPPVDPVDPPVDPVDPPVDPVDPPVDPVDPPVDPGEPADPADPADSVEPAEPAVPSEQAQAPAERSAASMTADAQDSASTSSDGVVTAGQSDTAVSAPSSTTPSTTSLAWTGATTAGLALAAASAIAGGVGLLAAVRRHSSR